jgi:hypothetical protein
MYTLQDAITQFGVDVDPHLDRQASIPVHSGLQAQGDVIVVPHTGAAAVDLVPQHGIAVVRGETGGNTHLLLADGPVFYTDNLDTELTLGVVTVPAGSVAYLAHPEHAYSGIAPGTYELRRQREQADQIRMVAD